MSRKKKYLTPALERAEPRVLPSAAVPMLHPPAMHRVAVEVKAVMGTLARTGNVVRAEARLDRLASNDPRRHGGPGLALAGRPGPVSAASARLDPPGAAADDRGFPTVRAASRCPPARDADAPASGADQSERPAGRSEPRQRPDPQFHRVGPDRDGRAPGAAGPEALDLADDPGEGSSPVLFDFGTRTAPS